MKRALHLVLALAAVAFGCVATPLPQPPIEYALDITRVQLAPQTSVLTLRGSPGAFTPGGVDIRVTPLPDPNQAFLPTPSIVTVAADGSFSVTLAGDPEGTFTFEAIETDRDVFVDAVSGESSPLGDGFVVTQGDAGPDRDEDGSPDVIDCAPDDPELGGSRCN